MTSQEITNRKKKAFSRSQLSELIKAAKSETKREEINEDLNIGEVVSAAWPGLKSLIAKKYSYLDIARWMIEKGVQGSEESLKVAIGTESRNRKKTVKSNIKKKEKEKTISSSTQNTDTGEKSEKKEKESPEPSPSPKRTVLKQEKEVKTTPIHSPAFNDEV